MCLYSKHNKYLLKNIEEQNVIQYCSPLRVISRACVCVLSSMKSIFVMSLSKEEMIHQVILVSNICSRLLPSKCVPFLSLSLSHHSFEF